MKLLYKKKLIILISIILYIPYASAEYGNSEPEESSVSSQSELSETPDIIDNTQYISVDIGLVDTKVSPFHMRIKYGWYFSQRTFFEAGLSFRPYHRELGYFTSDMKTKEELQQEFTSGSFTSGSLPFIEITYGYNFFTKDYDWTPGIDISLFVNPFPVSRKYFNGDSKTMLSGGIELAGYFKGLISKSYSVFLRPGIVYDSNWLIERSSYKLRVFISLGLQRHF